MPIDNPRQTPWSSRCARAACLVVVLLVGVGLSACAPGAASEALLPTATPAPSLTPTPTIVWFPPTPTRTLMPTQEVAPTPEQRPGVGALLLEDDLSGPRWPAAHSGAGSVAYGNSELTLAISQPKGALVSLSSEPTLDDFYAEVTTKASLCRDGDAYGLLLRASSEQDFYRFVINCGGALRLERANNGKLALLQDWTPSGQVPPGSPLVLRVGVWVAGKEMRFFIDDVYQFSASDPVFSSGRLGLYARSAGETPVTVSFSKLVVRSLGAQAGEALFTPTPAPEELNAP